MSVLLDTSVSTEIQQMNADKDTTVQKVQAQIFNLVLLAHLGTPLVSQMRHTAHSVQVSPTPHGAIVKSFIIKKLINDMTS